MKVTKTKKEIDEFETKTKCGRELKASSEKRLKHNLKMHELFCEKCKGIKK